MMMIAHDRSEIVKLAGDLNATILKAMEIEKNNRITDLTNQEYSSSALLKFTEKEILKMPKEFKKTLFTFVFICFLAAFIGSEFTNSSNATKGMDHMEVQNADGETILYNDTGEIIEMHVAETVENLKSRNGNKIFETNKGFYAMAINTLSSGSFYLRIAQGIMSMVHSEQIGNIILIILVFDFIVFVYFYIQNAYKVVARRIFLEGRIYSKIPSQRFALIIRIKKWSKVAFTMFVLAALKNFVDVYDYRWYYKKILILSSTIYSC